MNFLVDYLKENLVLSPNPIPIFTEKKIIDKDISFGADNNHTPMIKFNDGYYTLVDFSKNSERCFTYKFVEQFSRAEIKLIVSKMSLSTIYELIGPGDTHIASGYYNSS